MQKFVSFNCKIASATEVTISALSSAALYGKGIFTSISICNEQLFLWEKHWLRLQRNAKKLEIDLVGFSERKIKDALKEIIQKNSVLDGRARITFFDETESKIWKEKSRKRTSLSIITGNLRPISDNFRLTVSPHYINSHSPLTGIKSCNYLDKILALDEAKARGFDEAIQFNDRGEVTSATMANVFWLKGGVLYTPSLKTGCLPGTTREFILENMDCREVEVTIDELHSADVIFLTSAGLGVVQVVEFESRKIERTEYPILDLLPKRR